MKDKKITKAWEIEWNGKKTLYIGGEKPKIRSVKYPWVNGCEIKMGFYDEVSKHIEI